MKGKIFIVIFLALVCIASYVSESFAGQAQASAGVIVIIPPRKNRPEEKAAQEDSEKEELSGENTQTTYVKQ